MQSSWGGEDGQTGRAGPTQSVIPAKAIVPATGEDMAVRPGPPPSPCSHKVPAGTIPGVVKAWTRD